MRPRHPKVVFGIRRRTKREQPNMGANLWTNAVLIHLNPGVNGSAA